MISFRSFANRRATWPSQTVFPEKSDNFHWTCNKNTLITEENQRNTSCHFTHHAHGYGETQGGSRNRPTASPSYHGRRGCNEGEGRQQRHLAQRGQPHQVTQCHHVGPTPPHTGNRLNSHQCQRGTGNQSHNGHGARRAHHSNRHWSPTDAALCVSVSPSISFICILRLSTRTYPPADATQSSSSGEGVR